MRWEPAESPIAKAKRSAYKLLTSVRAALILLASAWHMEPRHFQPELNSIYKNLGWWIPIIPGGVYAWAAQALFAPSITERIPDFPVGWLLAGNTLFIVFFAHLVAFIDLGFHALMCGVGRAFQMRESPPPYEFFLVRASGGFMWFAVAVCLIALPVLALRHDTIGYFAASVLAVPLIWIPVLIASSFSWLETGSSGWVGLQKMYKSERFAKFVRRTQFGLAVFSVVALIFLNRHPEYLTRLFTFQHHSVKAGLYLWPLPAAPASTR